MTPIVELAGISRAFPGVVALDGVALSLQAGRVHALLGENGAGKSTLINVLGGSLKPDAGVVRFAGQAVEFANAHEAHARGIVVVHQEVDLFPDLTVNENLGLEQGLPSRWGWIDYAELGRRAHAALGLVHADLPPNTFAADLSPAQRQLLILAAALSQPARVLVLDEPTSSLSSAETAVLFELIRRRRATGTAILYVSHRFEEIFSLADEATVLRDGRRVWTGPLTDTTPAQLIGYMVGREVKSTTARTVNTGAVRFRCENVTTADNTCIQIGLEARAGEVLGLYGLVGAGRTEWAQGVLGLRPLASGSIWLNGKVVRPDGPGPLGRKGLAYVPEDRLRQGLCRGLPVRNNLVLATLQALARGLWLTRAPEIRRTREAVAQLGVRLRSVEQPVGTLSGGNQQKIVLGRWLQREPDVLILDEPTRGIDVAAKGEIHALIRQLADEGRAIVLISSDLAEVCAQSDRVGVFREGRLAGLFDPQIHRAEDLAGAALPDAPQNAACGLAGRTLTPKTKRRTLPLVAWREAGLLLLLVLFFFFVQARTGRFWQSTNLVNIAADASLLAICALGVAVVLIAGAIDISLGSLMALSAALAGLLWQGGWPIAVVVAVALLVGALGGAINAALTLVGRVHPIVITLGTLSVYRGLAVWLLQEDVQIRGDARVFLIASFAGLPVLVWVGLAAAVGMMFFLGWTVRGRELFAVGSNPDAARRVGISRARAWLTAFMLQGACAGLAGLFYLGVSGQLQSVSYEDKTLEAVAAAVVGGVAISGGRGSVTGVLLGCIFLVSLAPACLFLQVPTTWQRTLVGLVTVGAVTLDALWRRRVS